jgi:hypothetical protein
MSEMSAFDPATAFFLKNWASHAADAWRYLAMASREPVTLEEEKPNPVAGLLKPRTWASAWESYIDEQIELGAEPE